MKKTKKILKIIAINVFIFLVLLELIGLLAYYFKYRTFFYTDSQGRNFQSLGESNPNLGKTSHQQTRQLTNKRLHPFFGYTHYVNQGNTNNYGFYCSYDYPLAKKDKNWYIIGIFGGSVANDFYQKGAEQLIRKLKSHQRFKDKKIIFLNFALGGYKQPQQMQILTYFLSIGQEFDMVINIDGFNEVVFCFNNNRLNIDIAMPSGQHILPLRDIIEKQSLNFERLSSIWKIQKLKLKQNHLIHTIKNIPSASVYWFGLAYNKYLTEEYNQEILHFDKLIDASQRRDSLINIKYSEEINDQQKLLNRVVSFWSRCSTIMNYALLAQNSDALYFHFLQPNQYFSNKTFHPKEKAHALDTQLPYNFLVKTGYPALLEELKSLKKKNINVFSAVEIFDDIKNDVYIDKCCHFNDLGNQLFADFIAKIILDQINHKQKGK